MVRKKKRKKATYVIINVDRITTNMLKESFNNENSIRKSVDGTRAILKFGMKHPNAMIGIKKYTHTEMLQFLRTNKTEWEPDGPLVPVV